LPLRDAPCEDAVVLGDGHRQFALIHDWGENFTIRHLVMPNHVECCTYPVLDWVAEHMPEVLINIMDQCRPENFCDPRSAKYRPQYAELERRPTGEELRKAYGRARALNLQFETITFEKYAMQSAPAALTRDPFALGLCYARPPESVTSDLAIWRSSPVANGHNCAPHIEHRSREDLG
jgi:hypothetical protein